MCLNELELINPRYKKIAKSLGVTHQSFAHQRDYRIKVPCGKCWQCRKRRASDWRVRLINEVTYGKYDTVVFCTFTLDPAHVKAFESNPSKLVRGFMERYRYECRKKFGKSFALKHWFVVEYGETNGRIHLHGLLFSPKFGYETLARLWNCGFTYFENLRSAAGCSYIVKYITKPQASVGKWSGKVFVSPGFGRDYLTPDKIGLHKSGGENDHRIYFNNFCYALPRYYRTKIFSDDERRKLRFDSEDLHEYRYATSIGYKNEYDKKETDRRAQISYYFRNQLSFYDPDFFRKRIDALKPVVSYRERVHFSHSNFLINPYYEFVVKYEKKEKSFFEC